MTKRVEVRRGQAVLNVVESQFEFWQGKGFTPVETVATAKKEPAKRTSRRKTKAGE